MNLGWEQVVIEALDPESLGRWWSDALKWIIVNDDPNEFEIQPQANQYPGILFLQVREAKQFKNRLHLDFRPTKMGFVVSVPWRTGTVYGAETIRVLGKRVGSMSQQRTHDIRVS